MTVEARSKPKLSLTTSVDTMEEMLPLSDSAVSADSRDKLVAIHRPLNSADSASSGGHQTELLGIQQQPEPGNPGRIQTLLLHHYPDDASSSGWARETFPLPPMLDPAAPGGVLSGIRRLSGFHQNGITYLFVEYQSPVADETRNVQMLWSVMRDGKPVWQEKKWGHQGNDARVALASVRQLAIHRRLDGKHLLYGVTRGFGDPELGRGAERFFMLIPKPPENQPVHDSDIDFLTLHDSRNAAPNWQANVSDDAIYQIATPVDGESGIDDSRYTLLRLSRDGIEFHNTTTLPPSRFHDKPRLSFETGAIRLDTQGVDVSDATVQPVQIGTAQHLLVHQPNGTLGLITNYQTEPGYRSLLNQDGESGPLGAPTAVRQFATGAIEESGEQAGNARNLALFVTDQQSERLWVAHFSGDQHAPNLRWSCLGDDASALACPRSMPSGPELFAFSSRSGKLSFKQQNPLSSAWHDGDIRVNDSRVAAQPQSTDSRQTAHVFDIQVSDENQQPKAGERVAIRSEIPLVLHIDGRSYRSGPRLPIELLTNDLGRIRAILPTESMKAPKLDVQLVGETEAYPVLPNARVSERLAGRGRGFNIAESMGDLAPPEHRTKIVKLVKDFGHAVAKAERGAACNHERRSEFRMTLDGAPGFAENPQVASANTATLAENAPLTGATPVAANWIGDVFNFIREGVERGFQELRELVVTIYDASVRFVVRIGEQLLEFTTSVFESIVDGFEALGQFLGEVLKQLGSAVDDLGKAILKAISFIFKGDDVFAANDVIQASVKATLRTATYTASAAGQKINSAYQSQLDRLDGTLNSLLDSLDSSEDFHKQAQQQGFKIGDVEVPAPAALMQKNRAGFDVMASHRNQLADVDPSGGVKLAGNELDVLKNLIVKLQENHEKDVVPAFNDLQARLSSDNNLLDKIAASPLALLRLTKAIIKTLAKLAGDLLVAALELIRLLTERLFQALDAEIPIPFLRILVQLWSGDADRKLRFFDLLTLPFAFIGTAVWKLLSGKALATPARAREFVSWADQRPAPIDLVALTSADTAERPPLQATLPDKLQADESPSLASDSSVTAASGAPGWAKGVLGTMNALSIVVTLAGILVTIPFEVGVAAAGITGVPSGPVGTISTILGKIPLLVTIFTWLTKTFIEAYSEQRFPSGKAMDPGEVSTSMITAWITVGVMIFIVFNLIPLFFIKQAIPAMEPTSEFVLFSLLGLVVGVGMIGYYGYQMWSYAKGLGDKDEAGLSAWGLGLTVAQAVAQMAAMVGTIAALVAIIWLKLEPTSGSVVVVVALLLVGLGGLLTRLASAAKSGYAYARY